MSPIYVSGMKIHGNKSTANEPSSGNTEGDLYYNTTNDVLRYHNGSTWRDVSEAELGSAESNPATSAQALIDDGQSGDGYYWIKLPDQSTATQRWCDLTNGYMLFAHWSPNTDGSASQSPGSTSYAAGTGGYSGVTAAAVAAPSGSEDLQTSDNFVWDADTRSTNTGGSFFRNASGSGEKIYAPKLWGFQWRYMKWGIRTSIPGGTAGGDAGDPSGDNYNSMDNWLGASDADDLISDGWSLTRGNAGSRTHIFTVDVDGSNTSGNNSGSAPGFVGSNYHNLPSHSGATTSAYDDRSGTHDRGSASHERISLHIQSDQDSSNEDSYIRAWYILLK